MAKASANLNDIENFRSATDQARSAVCDSGVSAVDSVRAWRVDINAEVTRCTNLCDRITMEINSLESEAAALDGKIASLEAELAAMDPYKEYEWYDDDGNRHVDRVPNPACDAVREEISTLKTKRNTIAFKISSMKQLLYEAQSLKKRLCDADRELENVSENISESAADALEYADKALKLIGNITSILGAYLSIPLGTASATGAAVKVNAAAPCANNTASGGSAAYQGKDGTRVSYLGSPHTSSSGRKYTDGVLYEGKITFKHDSAEHTVDIKRKIYQYSPGIDLDYVRADGRTNREAMLGGESPIVLVKTKKGLVETKLELHHVTQQENIGFPTALYKQGTLLEIPVTSHKKYTRALHMVYPRDKGIRRSFRVFKMADHTYKRSFYDKQFNAFRKQYWRVRALMG